MSLRLQPGTYLRNTCLRGGLEQDEVFVILTLLRISLTCPAIFDLAWDQTWISFYFQVRLEAHKHSQKWSPTNQRTPRHICIAWREACSFFLECGTGILAAFKHRNCYICKAINNFFSPQFPWQNPRKGRSVQRHDPDLHQRIGQGRRLDSHFSFDEP